MATDSYNLKIEFNNRINDTTEEHIIQNNSLNPINDIIKNSMVSSMLNEITIDNDEENSNENSFTLDFISKSSNNLDNEENKSQNTTSETNNIISYINDDSTLPSNEQNNFYLNNEQNNKCFLSNISQNDISITNELTRYLSSSNKFTVDILIKFSGSFNQLLKNEQSSRICQFYLERTSPEVIHLIFNEIKPNLNQLLVNPYGNYFCLKIFYFLKLKDRISYLKIVASNLKNLSKNKISTYVIQSVIEKTRTLKEREILIKPIIPHLHQLTLDVYGSHIIEKVLNSFENFLVKPIVNFVIDNFLFLSNNPNGIIIVKKVLDMEYKKEYFLLLKNELIKHANSLIKNPYGNYALQEIIEKWELNDLKELLLSFYGNIVNLSTQKYSSNVIEKCIIKSEQFLFEFIYEIFNDSRKIILLLSNNYGNYVLHTAIKYSKFNVRMFLLKMIKVHLNHLQDNIFYMKWNNIVESYSDLINE